MNTKTLVITVIVSLCIIGLSLFFLRKEQFSRDFCKKYPESPMCNRGRIGVPPRIRDLGPPNINIPMKNSVHTLACQGGGLLAISNYYGYISALLKIKRDKSLRGSTPVSKLFTNFPYISGSSGGNIFNILLAYDSKFNKDINSIRNLTSENVREKYIQEHINTFLSYRDANQNEDLGDQVSPLELPYFVKLALMVMNATGTLDGVYRAGNIYDAGALFLQGRHNKTKMKDVLPEYRDINIVVPAAILTNGDMSVPGVSGINYSYNLPTGEACKNSLPYSNGPLTTSITSQGLRINKYSSNSLNTLRYWNGWRFPPGNLPDNTMFDTCEWVDEYEDGWFSDTLLPRKVYRCKNVASAECCQNNSEQIICPSASMVTFSSKYNTIPFTIPGVYDNNIKYYSYDIDVEKQPTGEWESRVTEPITTDALTSVIEVPTSPLNYDTSDELVKSVATTTAAATGIAKNICLVKSVIYRGGFSDQEAFVSRLGQLEIDLSCVFKGNSSSNQRIYKDVCSILHQDNPEEYRSCDEYTSRVFTSPNPNYDRDIVLKSLAKNKALMIGDSGFVDNAGILGCVRAHQLARSLRPLEITCFSIDDINVDYKPFFIPTHDSPLDEDAIGINKALTELMDVVNQVANWNIAQEAAFASGIISAGTLLSGLASTLSPYLGIAVAAGLIASLTEIVWEVLDLDTDYHVTTDRDGKQFSPTFARFNRVIFNTKFNPISLFSKTIVSRTDSIPVDFNVYKCDNLVTVGNKDIGVKAGTKVNITIISLQTKTSGFPLQAFFKTEGEENSFGDAAEMSFECLTEAYTSVPEVRRRMDAAFDI